MNAIVCSELPGDILLSSLQGWNASDITSIRLLGCPDEIHFTVSELGVLIHLPKNYKKAPAYVFQISSKDLTQQPFRVVNLESVKKLNEEAAKKYGATGNNGLIPLP